MRRFFNLFLIINLILIVLIGVRLWDPLPVQIARTSLFDLYQRLAPRHVETLPVTVIDIDEKSLSELGQWPWPRTLLTSLVEKLSHAQPLVIGFDILFAEPDRLSPSNLVNILPEQALTQPLDAIKNIDNDESFSQAIANNPIVLGTLIVDSDSGDYAHDDMNAKVAWDLQAKLSLPQMAGRLGNLPVLESPAHGVGVLTLFQEPDGVVRRVPTIFKIGENYWPSFGVELLRVALKAEKVKVNIDKAGIDSLEIGGIIVPANANGLTWVHFNKHQDKRFISATDILHDRVDLETLSGHILLVGASAGGLHDIKMTPMAQQMSGVEIWAQWLETSLFGQLLQRPNYIFISELMFVFLVGQLLIFLTFKAKARTSLLVFSTLVIVCGWFSWWLYSQKLQLFDISFPILTAGLLFAILMYLKFHKEEQQRKQIRDAFSHYLSPTIVDEISRNPQALKLGGEVRVITSLFTDLEGFTLLSEKFEAETLVDLINQYLDGICREIIKHEGTVDKIIGDAVHAIFGAPHKLSNHADKAVECALAIDKFSQQFRQQQLKQGFNLGVTRVGVNSGEAVVGNFGGQVRFDYTAYGDTINTASRIEGANQHLGTRICVTQTSIELCKKHAFRPVAQLTVKGKQDQIMVYEPIDNSLVRSYLEEYKAAFALLNESDPAAYAEFKKLSKNNPDDLVIAAHLKNLDSGQPGIKREIS